MKTATMRTIGVIVSSGILLTSCVSSKKYHRSEAEVAKLRSDSTTLANQGTSLQQSLTAEQQKNADLQKSVQSAASTNTGLQKNIAYYTDYAGKEQSSVKQIKDELNTTLASSGITDQDVTLIDGKIYVNIGEKSLFKGNTAALTTKGKELVDNIGQFVKNHEAVDISVADLQQATAGVADNGMNNSTDNNATAANTDQNNQSSTAANNTNNNSKNTRTKRPAVTEGNTDGSAAAATDKTTVRKNTVAVTHHKKVTHTAAASGEGKAVAYSSGKHNKYTTERNRRNMARVIAWKRQNTVADALLKNGIPKVKVVAQDQPENENAQKGVQVVLVHGMDDFYKHMNEAPAAGQPVSANP
jgi:outer membrane murein-binding lipoprotein Lpp